MLATAALLGILEVVSKETALGWSEPSGASGIEGQFGAGIASVVAVDIDVPFPRMI